MTLLRDEFATLDATSQAELVRTRQVSALELVDAAIERIEDLNPRINAVVRTMYDGARAAASGVLPEGPFTGVPFLLKDLAQNIAGVPTTSGSAFFKDYIPGQDSELVRRHRAAGLIALGKTNTPELGLLPTTESTLLGPARNPWDPARSTGGSSGGAAAAVASGMVPVAHASDGGGSIRIPASCCGVFGLKPTRGRTPRVPEPTGLSIDHCVSRTVRDSAAMLDATCEPATGYPYALPRPERPFLSEVGADPGRLRIGFTTKTLAGAPVHADCEAAVLATARLCENLGHDVVEESPPIPADLFTDLFIAAWYVVAALTIDGNAMVMGRAPARDQFEPLTWALAERGRSITAPRYLIGSAILQQITQNISEFFTSRDVWLTPMLTEPPLPLGSFDSPPEDPMRGFELARNYVSHTPICNVTGQPAMSMPLSWNEQGLPIGTHFIGRFGDEATLLRLAAQLEEAQPWVQRRPAVSAIAPA